MKSCIFIN